MNWTDKIVLPEGWEWQRREVKDDLVLVGAGNDMLEIRYTKRANNQCWIYAAVLDPTVSNVMGLMLLSNTLREAADIFAQFEKHGRKGENP